MGSKRSLPHCPQKQSRQTLGLPMFKHCISYQWTLCSTGTCHKSCLSPKLTFSNWSHMLKKSALVFKGRDQNLQKNGEKCDWWSNPKGLLHPH